LRPLTILSLRLSVSARDFLLFVLLRRLFIVNETVHPLSAAQIECLCLRAFGADLAVVDVTPLRGGTFNLVYRIELSNGNLVVLRLAPPATTIPYWDDVALMRREQAMQPYLAAVGHLLPRLLFVDFTHQVLDRDYMFQEFRTGERWEEIAKDLDEEDEAPLWQQFGAILRHLHDTSSKEFGWPALGLRYATWAEAVLARLEQLVPALAQAKLNQEPLRRLIAHLHAQPELLAVVTVAGLLHGDLWRFNLLVDRQVTPPQIVAVLDADRAWWGDPLADWTIFIFVIRRNEPEWQGAIAAFCESYGPLAPDDAAEQRLSIYKAMHLGTVVAWSHAQGDVESVKRASAELDATVAEILRSPHSYGQAI
jgi:aminoglycoside phosphotransferase (APT) family kinase protein